MVTRAKSQHKDDELSRELNGTAVKPTRSMVQNMDNDTPVKPILMNTKEEEDK